MRVGKMSDNDGTEVTLAKYKEDTNLQQYVRGDIITDLVLKGKYDEKQDNEFIEEIMKQCSQTKTRLAFTSMRQTLSADKIQVFPLLKKLIFYMISLENDSLVQLDWCPNLTELHFRRGFRMSEDAYETFTSTTHIYPQIKTFEFDMSESKYHLTQEFLAAMDTKFPSLECLDLTLSCNDNFSSHEPEYQVPYEPLYFKMLKKLSVNCFGEEVDQLLDYMAVCNAKLKEFTFMGMTTPTQMID